MTKPAPSPARPEGRQSDIPFETFITFHLTRVSAVLDRQMIRLLREHAGLGLNEWRVLAALSRFGASTSKALVDVTEIDKALVSRAVRSLQERGLVRQMPSRTDRRSPVLEPTAQGWRMLERMAPRVLGRQAALRAALTPTEQRVLVRALAKLRDSVRASEHGDQ